jgi:large subunit ribosomal protein L18e
MQSFINRLNIRENPTSGGHTVPTRKKTNEMLISLIADLKKASYDNKAPIWKDIARRLEKPSSSWAEVNIRHITENSKANDVVLVPGKLLGSGELTEPVTVAAYSTSESAGKKVVESGGKSISIRELVKLHPKGTDVKIIG